MAKTIQLFSSYINPSSEEAPEIEWVKGVLGFEKSTWVANNFNQDSDLIATTITEAAEDFRSKNIHSCEKESKIKAQKIALSLVNGAKDRPNRLLGDRP